MREFSLAEFAIFAASELLNDVGTAREKALEVGAAMIASEAKRVIGTYDYGWPQLAASTQSDRTAQGYAANEPLLRSGEMRDSISYTIVTPGVEAVIGSPLDRALWQELGTVTTPARSFLGGAAAHEGQHVANVVGEIVSAAVAGKSETEEILKLLKDVIKETKKTFNEIAQTPENENQRHSSSAPKGTPFVSGGASIHFDLS